MITIKHIAEQVGVSASTVARALADHPHIHEDTKARVRAAAQRLGYVAHAPARLMRGGRSTLVGLVIPDVRNDFYATVAQAISESCVGRGYQLMLSITGEDPARELAQVRSLASARAAGVIVVPSAAPLRETIALLGRMPHVQLIRGCDALSAPWFGIDDRAAIRIAVEYVVARGHRRIGYVGGDLSLGTSRERRAGYDEALARAGIAVLPALCRHGAGDVESGRAATLGLLALRPRMTALVTGTSLVTPGALDALATSGVAVPSSLSIVGFNDGPALAWWGPGITAIGLPVREIAMACAGRLLRDLEQPAAAAAVPARALAERAVFVPSLVERGSVGPPARR
jgi:LacI family transcriptional regulator